MSQDITKIFPEKKKILVDRQGFILGNVTDPHNSKIYQYKVPENTIDWENNKNYELKD